jgi:hypothetical protein
MKRWFTTLLLLAITLSMPQAFIMIFYPFHFEHPFEIFPASFKGTVDFETAGIYDWIQTSNELVFMLNAWSIPSHDVLLRFRLLFYCYLNGTLANKWVKAPSGEGVTVYDQGYQWCSSPSQIPFKKGQQILVAGTLIEPTEWNALRSTPTVDFFGDLYVFQVRVEA